ncbi:MAG: hypothetical protein J6U58_00825 [Bacteroidaceae bacterium]|nr:hypothetical protein [Bacteroidaceae bacterium]
MRQKIIFTVILSAMIFIAQAQISPEQYSATHSDSCWYFTFDYPTPKISSNTGMVIVTHLCTPDTCISSATRHLQGKRYARRYIKRYGTDSIPDNNWNSCCIAIPETAINDTIYGVTYCEYSNRKNSYQTYDTVAICMPQTPPMSNHRVTPARSIADHLAMEHPHVKSIRYYTPLTAENAKEMDVTPSVVRYRTNSNKLNTEYLMNANNIDELMSIIDDVLSDSTTHLEAIQFVGYTSPDGSEKNSTDLGYARAAALRNHVMRHHHLPDSIFEVADGGNNWNFIYDDIRSMNIRGGEELITKLKAEPSSQKREIILKRYDGGRLYTQLTDKMFPAHRIACCTGIYYQNDPDSTAIALNEIVDELTNNPHPDYRKLINRLKHYRDDPRVLNMQGVLEYRRHHRHAAEKAFTKAAAMGDEQALTNLRIVEANKRKE